METWVSLPNANPQQQNHKYIPPTKTPAAARGWSPANGGDVWVQRLEEACDSKHGERDSVLMFVCTVCAGIASVNHVLVPTDTHRCSFVLYNYLTLVSHSLNLKQYHVDICKKDQACTQSEYLYTLSLDRFSSFGGAMFIQLKGIRFCQPQKGWHQDNVYYLSTTGLCSKKMYTILQSTTRSWLTWHWPTT